jgi:DNA (cytosine-5)-methyltransferase 1
MNGMTVCSGIGAPERAAPWIDWRWQSEIEPFPCSVLRHRFPDANNLGDMTKFQEWPDATVDVLCGGTPCQSFSVAGLRKGLADPRGNLMLTYLAIADRFRPRWIVWENVPGVLSSNGGRDFGSFLGGLGQLGYGFAYRVLDAQFVRSRSHPRAVPQRRRRVFVVGYLGDWRRAAAVLFDGESMSGNPPPRREAGERPAPTLAARTRGGGGLGADFDCDEGLICHDVAPTLNAHFGDKQGLEDQHINGGAGLFVAHALRGEGFDASEDGTGRGTPLVPVAYRTTGNNGAYETGDVVGALTTTTDPNAQVVAFQSSQSGIRISETHATLDANNGSRRHNGVVTPWAVRRLTPVECERLQGFPDGWTDVSHRNKPAADGPRYKALGNSWAVNCGEWLFDRIREVDAAADQWAGWAEEKETRDE